jgi:hypothetical protein
MKIKFDKEIGSSQRKTPEPVSRWELRTCEPNNGDLTTVRR